MGLTKCFKQERWSDKRYYLMEDLIEWVQEYVVVTDSFYPALLYYLNRLKELGSALCGQSLRAYILTMQLSQRSKSSRAALQWRL